MPLEHPLAPHRHVSSIPEVAVNPVFTREPMNIPKDTFPPVGIDPQIAYQIVHDELMLDGNARLNLATFVTTWMEAQATRLMTETFDKNMIDKDEYPRTAELEARCVRMLASCGMPRNRAAAVGCSTTGSSEACMLGRPGHEAPVAAPPAGGGQADRPAEHRHGHQCPDLLGQVRQLLGRRAAAGADGGRPVPAVGRGGGQAVRREHHRCRGDHGLHVRRRLRAGRRGVRRAGRVCRSAPASTSRCTWTVRPAR